MNFILWFSNISVCMLIIFGIISIQIIRRSLLWSEMTHKLWAKRKYSILILGLYVFIGILDSILWIGKTQETADSVKILAPISIIDVIFQGKQEKTYSAPLANTLFGKQEKLLHQGVHLLGTDLLGRDVFYQTIKAVRPAMILGGVTTLLVIPFALIVGMLAGYFKGWVDDFITFIMQVLNGIPDLLLLIAIIMALGRGTLQVCIAMAVTSWVGLCRITRGETLKLCQMDYVEAAKALGVHPIKILLIHIAPNLSHIIIINFTLFFCGQILAETILAYLGIGMSGSWGMMIDQARSEFSRDPIIWWNLASAGSALITLILCVNLIGDTARDIFDPRTMREI